MYENDNYVDHTENYENYRTEYAASAVAPKSNKEKRREKKLAKKTDRQGGVGKRSAVLVLSGLLFGVVAGVSFIGVNHAWDAISGNKNTGSDEVISEDKKDPVIDEIKINEPQQGVVYLNASDDITGMVEEVMPAMVIIVNNGVETTSGFFGNTYTREVSSSGSGIIVGQTDTDLLIATNNHVVENTVGLDVTFVDGSTAQAQIKGLNAKMDLAVLTIPLKDLDKETKEAITIAAMGDSEALKLGEPVVAIGNALGYGQSVTRGIVSALDREITSDDGITGTFIQTDTAINPGNSGGALLNMKGEVIGINSSKIGGAIIEGMGYAIPINAANPIISDLITREVRDKVDEKDRGYMGIRMQAVTSSMAQAYNWPIGVYIIKVEEDTPAEKAGLMMGDIIVGFDGLSISDATDLEEALQYYKAGETIEIEVMRLQNGKYESVMLEITLARRPE